MTFNYSKYFKWRSRKTHIDEDALRNIEHMKQHDGRSYDEMWKDGIFVIKDWFDREETDEQRKII